MDRYYYDTENGHYRLRDRQNGQQTVALIFHVTEADLITKLMNAYKRLDSDARPVD